MKASAEEGSGAGRYGCHDQGNGEEGDEQEVELEVFADGAPEELTIVVGGDGG